MELFLLFLRYFALAGVVVYAAMQVGHIVDEIDNRTHLSGAFVGGLLLAAVTSLPEFITSITSTVVYNEPGLAFGNIFGSNFFNIAILAIMDIIFVRKLAYYKIKEIRSANNISIVIYLIVLLPFMMSILVDSGILNIAADSRFFFVIQNSEILGFSLMSIAILILYFISARTLAEGDSDEEDEGDSDSKFSKYSVTMVGVLFLFWAAVLVAAAYFITGTTNQIAIATELNTSFVGALFLGVATSLPELVSVYTLMKLNNFDAAAGGVIGSNVFNFSIIALVDFIETDNIIDLIVNDPAVSQNALSLLILGLINSIILMLALLRKKREEVSYFFYLVPSVLIITNYVFYLIVSFV